MSRQSEIVQYKFRGSGFLETVEFAEVKRAIWDEGPLVLLLLISLILIRKRKNEVPEEWRMVSRLNVLLVLLHIAFIFLIEIANDVAIQAGKLPVFVDHLRIMRAIGPVLIMQSILLLVILGKNMKRPILVSSIAVFLIIPPIRFSAPAIRSIVRAVVPETIRLRYNLAPIVSESDNPSFEDLKSAALWARENLPNDPTKIFVFDDFQDEFRFKILSRHDTNLTGKEGNLWVTSGYKNSRRWYDERLAYKKIVGGATDFSEITDFARSLGLTHLLLPRGTFSELYRVSGTSLPVLYENPDYRILEL